MLGCSREKIRSGDDSRRGDDFSGGGVAVFREGGGGGLIELEGELGGGIV